MKSAVIYYSRTGKTSAAAKALAEKTSGDLIEIKDLKNRKGIIGWIRAAMDARAMKITSIEPSTIDTSRYDRIFIGTPVWAGKPAPAINTVLKNFNLSGKDVTLFATLGGGNYKNMLNLMASEAESNGIQVSRTFAVLSTGKKSDDDIRKEINDLNI
ncbi:MAG: flavodoxin family protein [Methanobacterium sp.]